MKNIRYILPILLAGALAVGVFLGGALGFTNVSEELFSANTKKMKLNKLIDYIDYEYVDHVNTDSIVEVAVNNILENLDPHSVYLSKYETQKISENMKGGHVSIGVNFFMYRDTVSVVNVTEGGPSKYAGVKPGDRILSLNGEILYGKNLSEEKVNDKLKGVEGSAVKLQIYRKGEKDILDIEVKRKNLPIKSVDSYYMLADSLGYIKINRFAESTYDEFLEAFKKLQAAGIKKLVLDLRNNPGGYVSVAERIVDEFLEEGKLILFTKNKSGSVHEEFATPGGLFENGEVYVLINEISASASEIVAGALQDNDKGTIVGRRSFGKGLVQREMNLGDGSSIRLTVSRYYTPTGRSIQRPYRNGTKDYYDDFYARYESGEMESVDKIKVADSLIFKTPKGKIVYGGGGIIPDVFVPFKPSFDEESLSHMLRSGFLNFYVFEHLDKNRDLYSQYSRKQFVEEFEVSDELFDNYVRFAQKGRYILDYPAYVGRIKKYIKAMIGKQLYNKNIYEQIMNQNDDIVNAVLRLNNSGAATKDDRAAIK
ncbi:S41 family peptidase [Abyssalbus ytuae]|uniref:S41 family peptidase n=1 Tax=Abyssalbus ytuae TaxID=2926907 RepID=A0A9E7D1U2_9FLAO|nr:S41 family peptidase [Abyssalbus ytuae]UOB15999.1 S41 family peptidase [Abyssalbus ytuae]